MNMKEIYKYGNKKSLLKFLSEGSCGERGIRTPGPVKINGFQDRRIRPLCHLSKVEFYFARFIFSVKWIAKVRIFLEKTRGWAEKIRKFRNFEKICGETGIRTPNPER